MNHLDVGLDKGRSKTNLAVARADGHLVLEARIEHFDQFDPQPITDEGLLHLIAQHLTPFKAHPLSLFLGGYLETPRSFFDGLSGDGFDIQALEVFTDVHNHYGLTDMPGNAVTVACGSHWNAMYYDHANNVICFASPCAIWDYVPHSFEGITFARFLLAWWCEAWDQGTTLPLANEILARTGLSAATLRNRVKQDPCWTPSPRLVGWHWVRSSPNTRTKSRWPRSSPRGSASSRISTTGFVRRLLLQVRHGSCWEARSGATGSLSEHKERLRAPASL